VSFRHSLAARRESDNLVVECLLADGTAGFGEGVPRDYVTGETIESSLDACRGFDKEALSRGFQSFDEVLECLKSSSLVARNTATVLNNSARCALELSVLDAFGKYFGKSLADVSAFILPEHLVNPRPISVKYSPVLSAGGPFGACLSALKFRLYGFRQIKVKVGLGRSDFQRLKAVRRMAGRDIDIRLDANGAWNFEEAKKFLGKALRFGISCVEEPLRRDCKEDLKCLREEVPIPVMLDESLRTLEEAREAAKKGLADMFNIRISKCGGFIRSLEIVALASDKGLGWQLGCQVGETGLLSAAGRHFASTVKGARYIEGSYGRHLLSEDITREDLTFSYGGKAPPIAGFGLGVELDRRALAKVTLRKEVLKVE